MSGFVGRGPRGPPGLPGQDGRPGEPGAPGSPGYSIPGLAEAVIGHTSRLTIPPLDAGRPSAAVGVNFSVAGRGMGTNPPGNWYGVFGSLARSGIYKTDSSTRVQACVPLYMGAPLSIGPADGGMTEPVRRSFFLDKVEGRATLLFYDQVVADTGGTINSASFGQELGAQPMGPCEPPTGEVFTVNSVRKMAWDMVNGSIQSITISSAVAERPEPGSGDYTRVLGRIAPGLKARVVSDVYFFTKVQTIMGSVVKTRGQKSSGFTAYQTVELGACNLVQKWSQSTSRLEYYVQPVTVPTWRMKVEVYTDESNPDWASYFPEIVGVPQYYVPYLAELEPIDEPLVFTPA